MKDERIRYDYQGLHEKFVRTPLNISLKRFLVENGVRATGGQLSGNILKNTKGWINDRVKHRQSLIDKAGEEADKKAVESLVFPIEQIKKAKKELLTLLDGRLNHLIEKPVEKLDTDEVIKILQAIKTELGEPVRINHEILNTDDDAELSDTALSKAWEALDAEKSEAN